MNTQIKSIRRWIVFFMVMLFLSGLTAMPAETELTFLSRNFPSGTALSDWLEKIYTGVADTNKNFPFIAYGYDWLAFAHFVFAILFIGVYRDPVKNKWIVEFGMIACLLVIPFAFIAGHFRDIPFWWRMIDCSFGIFGLLPLIICHKKIRDVEASSMSQPLSYT